VMSHRTLFASGAVIYFGKY